MKKGILSFAVVLTFSIVNVLGCFSALAVESVGNTHVAVQTNVKSVIIDDDFEDRTPDTTMVDDPTLYAKPVAVDVESRFDFKSETNDNKFLQTNTVWTRLRAKPTNGSKYGIDCDRLAISFDIADPAAFDSSITSTGVPAPTLYASGKPIFKFYLKETGLNNQTVTGVEVKYFSSKSEKALKNGSDTYYTQRRTSGNWNHVELTLKRVASNGGYTVELESLKANGTEFNLSNTPYANGAPDFASINWWTEKENANEFIEFGNASSNFAIDNVLIYAPGEYVTPRVSATSSMAPVKTIYVDDNFNDRTVDTTLAKSSYEKSIPFASDIGVASDGDGNLYATPKSAWGSIRLFAKNNLDCDVIALHFKYKLGTATSNNAIDLNFGTATGGSAINAMKFGSVIRYVGTDGTVDIGSATPSSDDWIYIDVSFEKKLSGESYGIFLKQLSVNGVAADISQVSDVAVQTGAKTWWENDDSKYFMQFGAMGICLDDLLLYEPATISTGFEVANFTGKTITIRNAGDDSLDLTDSKLIVAAYDNGGALLNAQAYTIGENLASGALATVDFNSFTVPNKTAYYKFFAWDDLNNMTPLLTQAEVTAK